MIYTENTHLRRDQSMQEHRVTDIMDSGLVSDLHSPMPASISPLYTAPRIVLSEENPNLDMEQINLLNMTHSHHKRKRQVDRRASKTFIADSNHGSNDLMAIKEVPAHKRFRRKSTFKGPSRRKTTRKSSVTGPFPPKSPTTMLRIDS